MRKFRLVLAMLFLTVLVHAATSFAQSSGSFSASYNATQCAITAADGSLTNGVSGPGSLPPITVKVSSGSGVGLVITPSLVTGLYTKNRLGSTSTTPSTQNVGLRVKVTVDNDTTYVVPELGGDE